MKKPAAAPEPTQAEVTAEEDNAEPEECLYAEFVRELQLGERHKPPDPRPTVPKPGVAYPAGCQIFAMLGASRELVRSLWFALALANPSENGELWAVVTPWGQIIGLELPGKVELESMRRTVVYEERPGFTRQPEAQSQGPIHCARREVKAVDSY